MERKRANYLHVLQYFRLDQACRMITDAWGVSYLVGSVLERPDWRDVDIRLILDDEEFAKMFPESTPDRPCPAWMLVCRSVSALLSEQSGLPVDFQIQQRTDANSRYDKPRSSIGFVIKGGRFV